MRSYSCFRRSIEEENVGNGAHLLVVAAVVVSVLVVVLFTPVVMVMVIFGFRKKNAMGYIYASTAKSAEASSQSSNKMKGGRYKGVLLLISLKIPDRYS